MAPRNIRIHMVQYANVLFLIVRSMLNFVKKFSWDSSSLRDLEHGKLPVSTSSVEVRDEPIDTGIKCVSGQADAEYLQLFLCRMCLQIFKVHIFQCANMSCLEVNLRCTPRFQCFCPARDA